MTIIDVIGSTFGYTSPLTFLVIVPYYGELLLKVTNLSAIAVMRVLRTARILRILKIGSYSLSLTVFLPIVFY